MMQNPLAINPQVASLEQEIRFTQYRLQITGDVSVRWSTLARLRDLRDQLNRLAFSSAAVIAVRPKPRNWGCTM